MGFLGDLFGSKQEAAKPNLINPATAAQATASQDANLAQMQQQQALLAQLQAQGGIGNQTAVFNQQQALANQLQDAANGGGPNPAAAQLANATGANVANQAALMASQRGGSANAGLIARQAAMQGAGIQQNAAGQAAALQAQQQLAARSQLMQQQQQLAGLAGQQVGQQMGQQNINQGAAANNQNALFGQVNNQNQFALGQAAQQNQVNEANSNRLSKGLGGLFGAAGSALSGPLGNMFGGASGAANSGMGGVSLGNYSLNNMTPQVQPSVQAASGSFGSGLQRPSFFAGGGQVGNGPSSRVGQHFAGLAMQSGGQVPGQAEVKGDSFNNDTVPAMLSPGEIVIPRSVMQSSNPTKAAADFVAAIMRKNGRKS